MDLSEIANDLRTQLVLDPDMQDATSFFRSMRSVGAESRSLLAAIEKELAAP